MNLYKKTEALLYSYKTLIAEVKNLQLEIDEIEYIGCGAINYEEKAAPTNSFNSIVENEVLSRDKQLSKLKKAIFLKENKIKRMDNALESLDERSRELIKLRYFDKLNYRAISRKVDLSEDYLNDLTMGIVKKISGIIFV